MPPHDAYIESHLGGGAIIRNKQPARRNIGIDIDPQTIKMWADFDQVDFELIRDDAVRYLKDYQFTGKELVYCDPPYLRETRKKSSRLYKYEYTKGQHAELLNVIKSLPCKVMISGYESQLYKEHLKNWNTYSFKAGCQHGIAIEWVWMNYSTPQELHDYRYLGNSFRERERLKKKLKNWTAKFKSMPVLERKALLNAMYDVDNAHQSWGRL